MMNQDDQVADSSMMQSLPQEEGADQSPPSVPEGKVCEDHMEELILYCLKDQKKVCSRCLKLNHLLHPVVPLSSIENLDFSECLNSEISNALKDVKSREDFTKELISACIVKHKVTLRNHIIFIREGLKQEFDEFFNSLLQSIRGDWNLFSIQEVLVNETKKFNSQVTSNLENLIQLGQRVNFEKDIQKFYENLSDGQTQVQKYKEEWYDYEKSMTELMKSLKEYSELEVMDGNALKNFMAENLVMNYSNIEMQRILFQQNHKNSTSQISPILPPQFRKHSYSVLTGNPRLGQSMQLDGNPPRSGPFEQSDEPLATRIHFFKFDQRILTFYNIDNDKKTKELLNIEFNIPIRFCSIQTNDGRIFITGGAKNSSHSSNHAYEYRNGALVQLPNMINPREGHCLAAIGSKCIYAIGSRLYNTSKTCEVYSIQQNEWREQPELNRNRYLSTAVTVAERFIYIIGGYEPQITDIERLDTQLPGGSYWELIKIYCPSLENDIKYWFGACAISKNEILIFGGKKDGQTSNSTYIFDTQQNHIVKTANLPHKDTFYQRTFLVKGGKVYAYGYENDNAYIFLINSKTWTKKQ